MLLPQVRLRACIRQVSVLYSSVRTRISQLSGKCVCWGKRDIPAGDIFIHAMCVFSNSMLASVRIPGGVAHIEIGVEVNKWE